MPVPRKNALIWEVLTLDAEAPFILVGLRLVLQALVLEVINAYCRHLVFFGTPLVQRHKRRLMVRESECMICTSTSTTRHKHLHINYQYIHSHKRRQSHAHVCVCDAILHVFVQACFQECSKGAVYGFIKESTLNHVGIS